ncbi:hypothetical protein LTR70_004172 [Exophiala xenobiotica]|uniref:Translation initiation factor eIF2B subunit delta n=1 Tax=Lithohypha guttulata TaxID=1690604 RepID=A0ABR0KE40_9EURO|nr:hypothetical protein LTR24_003654 [Lithohypha guttulata]KAK5321459.1 hypothetical protein LTR70_004172 [Exophiala xenobiotica]
MSENAPSTNGVSASSSDATPSFATMPDPASIAEQTPDTNSGARQERPQPKQASTAENIAEAGAGVKLTGAQLKQRKQAEKAARRAEKVTVKGEQAQIQQVQSSSSGRPDVKQRRSSQGEQLQTPQSHHKRKLSNQPPEPGAVRIPFRPGQQPPSTPQTQQPPQPKHAEKRVPLVSHLYPSGKPASLTTASREIHPSVLTLALQLRNLTIAGSTARTLSLLLTLKRVIKAYTTPPSTALSRHLTTHLSHQISFLSSARPLGIAQGNAIRWLKKLISQLDPDLDDNDAKKFLCDAVDSFIQEKVTLASEVIASQACSRIEAEGETILVFGKSSVVEKALLKAAKDEGKKFRVVVVDSRPLFEGRNLAKGLLRAGMREGGDLDGCQVVYSLISGLADALEQNCVTKCFLGASGMLGNGSLYSRCGSAMVAMMAKQYNVPVIVLGESLKFTAKMAVDSLSLNEVGDADALVERDESQTFTSDVPPKQEDAGKKGGGGKKKGGDEEQKEEDEDASKNGLLESWRDHPNLYLLNLMYDITPKDYLDMVICELGTLPPGAVPVIGVHGGDE